MRNARTTIWVMVVAAVLLLSGTARAVLTVETYIIGQEVVLDSVTGDYWYRNMPDFTDMTYAEQQTAIGALGNYGNIAGGWHMATHDEVAALFLYSPTEFGGVFEYTYYDAAVREYSGREEHEASAGYHYFSFVKEPGINAGCYQDAGTPPDTLATFMMGAWVTTSAAVIPAPGALALVATGLLPLLGVNRWRRRR